MSDQIGFFLIEFFIFLFCISGGIFGSYLTGWIAWIKYTKKCVNIFNNDEKIKNISFFIKEYKYKYFASFIFFILFNFVILCVFSWLWIIISKDLYLAKNINLFWVFIITFLILYFLFTIKIKKFWSQIKKIGIYSKREAIEKFKKFQEEITIEAIQKFEIKENNQNTNKNYYFQYQQKNYQKKIQKLSNKKIKKDKYDIKLLKLFTNYLKINAAYIDWIKPAKYNILIKDIEEFDKSYYFPDIIINNFFAYAQQAQEELH